MKLGLVLIGGLALLAFVVPDAAKAMRDLVLASHVVHVFHGQH